MAARRKTNPPKGVDPIAIAKKMLAKKKPRAGSVYDQEPFAGWLVALVELKIEKQRELTWKMVAQSLTEAAEQAKLSIPEAGYTGKSIANWVETRHPKLYEKVRQRR